MNGAHHDSRSRYVKANGVRYGGLGIDRSYPSSNNAFPTHKGLEELDSHDRVKPHRNQTNFGGRSAEIGQKNGVEQHAQNGAPFHSFSFPILMNAPFVLIVPGCPMISSFQQVQSTQYLLFVLWNVDSLRRLRIRPRSKRFVLL